MLEKPKIKLSELTEMYDIEQDDRKEVKDNDTDSNFDMEIEEVIDIADKKLEKEFRDG